MIGVTHMAALEAVVCQNYGHRGPGPLPAIPFRPIGFDQQPNLRRASTVKALLLISLGWLALLGWSLYPEAQLIGIAACTLTLMMGRRAQSERTVIIDYQDCRRYALGGRASAH
jgi:hypothetical protein